MLTLLVLQGPDKGRRFELPDVATLIGRDSRQLPLTDNTVSRRHAELHPNPNGWILKDLGSSNGTYINGVRVNNTYALKLGDQMRVGRTILVYGAQPGVSRASAGSLAFAGEDSGMDASIMHTVNSNDDSMVLAVPEPAAAAMTNLKLLYQLGAALGSSFDVQQVLEVVMDLVFEHVQADHGIILLLDSKDELKPRVVRQRDPNPAAKSPKPTAAAATKSDTAEKPQPEKIHASLTIINHVMKSGEAVLSSNAMTDKLFSKSQSVHNLGIRSALCVPIKSRRLNMIKEKEESSDEIYGVIYVDSAVRNYTYSPDQLRLLSAIGMQAGMAVQNSKLYEQGLAAERLSTIGETTAALSHSIKNILQALRGGADVVEMGFRNSNIVQASKGWRIVDRNLEKIYNLTMNLLAYSKPREPKLEAVNPKKIVDECLELIAPMANEKGVMCVADVERDHPPVPVDEAGLHQVLMNLLSNAIDAVEPNQGLIRVVGRYDADNAQAVLQVIDNGAGVPASMMDHMFELFHSTKGNRGTGIGLAVTKKIVDEHDGSITVRSAPGEGTTFTIKLPVYHDKGIDPGTTMAPRK